MKKLLTILILGSIMLSLGGTAYAACQDMDTVCSAPDFNDPHPLGILCLIVRVLRIFIYAAGIIFVCMMGYGAWKMSMALGDPKSLAGARLALTYAVIGLFVVLGFFMFFSILSGILGINSIANPNALIDRIYKNLCSLLEAIMCQGPVTCNL